MEKIVNHFVPDYSQFWHCLLAIMAIISIIDFRWQKHAGMAFHAIAGAILLVAPFLLHKPTMIGDFDRIHLFLQRFSGAFHLGYAFFELRNLIRKNLIIIRGESIIYFAKSLNAAFLVITNLLTAYNLYDTKARGVRISPNFLSSILMVDGIWFLVECIHMAKQKYTTSDEIDLLCKRTQRLIEGRTSNNTQNLLWLDSALSFFYSFFNFAFPGQLLKAVIHREYIIDGIHTLFVRHFACYTLVSAIISLVAANFIIQQQKSYMLQRILTQIIIFSLHAYGHFILEIYNTLHVTPFLVSGFYITLLLIIYYRIRNDELHEIPIEKENGTNRQTVFTVKKSTKTA